MKIATYNVNGINARLPRLLEWLDEQKPDIVCLQELKADGERIPEKAMAEAGYGAVWHGQKGFNGVAILAREAEPREFGRGLPGDPEDEQSRYIEAEIGDVIVASIYLPNGNPQPGPKFDYKLQWMERLLARAEELFALERPVVLAGDYNVIPTDEDTHSVDAMKNDALTQPESRAAFRRLAAMGWTDAIRARFPSGKIWTYWDYQAGAWQRDAGFRIDHLMLSPVAADRLCAAGVDKEYRGREKASDHTPVWIELAEA
ncbi:exodeoxyribonuclease III [Parasphingopyxis marina]|uniref:Exodeoxyribonuclease III n=1 Tax=Parasphingopyxis marina TaxID=2761622 RepID=A0A842HX00_9SPHN|nr:exodeoxyribonuclease III [Parasphingopyxis marina]MBC2776993.1 exodeoxyribonuclease III [Parasphingopyxis marina]